LDKGEEPIPEGAAYIVIVADNGADGRPDSSSVKAFFCTADQGVNYHTGVWRTS
jgi:ureidoglycolate hydrolase